MPSYRIPAWHHGESPTAHHDEKVEYSRVLAWSTDRIPTRRNTSIHDRPHRIDPEVRLSLKLMG